MKKFLFAFFVLIVYVMSAKLGGGPCENSCINKQRCNYKTGRDHKLCIDNCHTKCKDEDNCLSNCKIANNCLIIANPLPCIDNCNTYCQNKIKRGY